jgi:hypothetical protein
MKRTLYVYSCLLIIGLFTCFPDRSSGWTYSGDGNYQRNYNNFWNMDYSYPTPTDDHI